MERNIGRAHRVAAAIEAGMCFVNSQNVRDLRQPSVAPRPAALAAKAAPGATGKLFLEPKNVAVSLGSHHDFRTGACDGSSRCADGLSSLGVAPPQVRGRAGSPPTTADLASGVIVPFPPGGRRTRDATGGNRARQAIGQSVIVGNRPGAGTVIGVDAAAKRLRDGYTFVTVANSFANHTGEEPAYTTRCAICDRSA